MRESARVPGMHLPITCWAFRIPYSAAIPATLGLRLRILWHFFVQDDFKVSRID